MKKNIIIIIICCLAITGILLAMIFSPSKKDTLNNWNMSNSNNSIIENINNEINKENEVVNNQKEDIRVNLIVNSKKFKAIFYNNDTTKELIDEFPMTLNMDDLHSNEKYNYLSFNLKTNSYVPSRINAGDIKLYGSNCLVVFYKSFSNPYSYTDLGYIEDVDSFVSELGNGSITMTFELGI